MNSCQRPWCQARAREEVRTVGAGQTPVEYWDKARETKPPYIHNRIDVRTPRRMTDAEILAAVTAARDSPSALVAMMKRGPVVEAASRRCEWCDQPVPRVQGDGITA